MKTDSVLLEKLSKRSALSLTEEQKKRFSVQFGEVVAFMEQLKKAPRGKRKPEEKTRVRALERADQAKAIFFKESLQNAPSLEGSSFKVPLIIS